MEVHKLCVFMATLIALISLPGSQADDPINCTITGSETTLCSATAKQCFIRSDANGVVTRGCLEDATGCVEPACFSCTGELCNKFLMCSHCYGTQTECATTAANGTSFNQLCTSATQVCRNEVNSNGTVSRGCADTACANADDAKCKSCSEDNCNVGIFPADGLQCYQCSGADCNSVTSTQLLPCSIYGAEDQQCYTTGTDDKTMTRGCNTDGTTKDCATGSTNANCVFCKDLNGCNNRTFSSVLGSCIKCNNSDTCVAEQDTSKAENCAASNYTQSVNKCYYELTSSGTVARGCVNELTDNKTCNAEENCESCDGSACNVKAGVFTCLTCVSSNYEPCRQAEVGPEPCVNTALNSNDSMQCYSGEWNGVVVRGCYIDMNSLEKYQCANNKVPCTVCSGMNCNTETEKYNGAAALQIQFGTVLLGVIFVVVRQLH